MKPHLIPVAAALLLLGAGCPSATAPKQVTPPSAVTESPAEVRSPDAPFYQAYSQSAFDAARAEKRPILLYFWAAWCPICQVEEPRIKAIVEGMDVPVAGFRVNYDTESSLKAQYKIPYQHTTVVLNTKGEETKRFFGGIKKEELETALRTASQ